jgi:hypothetical protein
MAITVTPTLAKASDGTTLSWVISFTSPHSSDKDWAVTGPNKYNLSGTANSTSQRTEAGVPGDVHVWTLTASARNSLLDEIETVTQTVAGSVRGSGVYFYNGTNWVPLNF